MLEERAFWLAWAQVPGIGPVLLRRLQQHFGTLSQAWQADSATLLQVEGFGFHIVEAVIKQRSRLNPQQLLLAHAQKNSHFWTPADSAYPRLLLETSSLPPVLYYGGKVELSENHGIKPLVGIVGTRDPSDYGKRWTRKISTVLARSGFTVVSGLAAGIDTEAHQSCLEAGGSTPSILN